jgi:hypothetical protein
MKFMNEDLRQLKEEYPIAGIEAIGNKLPALIARLEAAEAVCKLFVGPGVIHPLVKKWQEISGQ